MKKKEKPGSRRASQKTDFISNETSTDNNHQGAGRQGQTNLYDEFASAVESFGKDSLNALVRRYGVSSKTRFYLPGSAIGFAHIETDGSLYQPTDDRRSNNGALVMATAILADGGIDDLLAFRPSNPDSWFLRKGVGRWLGEWQIGRRIITRPLHVEPPALAEPCRSEDPLHIFNTPLEWLRNGGDGCVALVPGSIFGTDS